MNVRDVRKISGGALEELRRRVVAAVDSGASQVETARVFGVSRPTVNRWVRAYQESGEESFRPRRRGRREGTHRALSVPQQAQVIARMTDDYPESNGLPGTLWTRQTVADLIAQLHGIRLTLNTVSSYLRRWGLAQSDSLPHAAELGPAAMRRWLRARYPVVAGIAEMEGAAVFWVTWNVLGEDPDVNPSGPGEPGTRGVLSAVSNRRSLLFGAYGGPCSGDLVSEFLNRLSMHTGRRTYVVIDLFPMERPGVLRSWLDDHQGRVSAHFPLEPVAELRAR